MTSKHGKRIALGLGLFALLLSLPGCYRGEDDGLTAPYEGRHVWAVAPLRNESGTTQANGVKLADKLTQRLETVEGLEVLPVNRVLAAMRQLGLPYIANREQAMEVLRTIGADGLVLGSISAWAPYEPPKLGLSVELYTRLHPTGPPLDVRELSRAATDPTAGPEGEGRPPTQPVATVSALYDASEPATRQKLNAFAEQRGRSEDEPASARLYRISMPRYSEFVSYAIVERLLDAERARLARQRKAQAGGSAPAEQNRSDP
jgi:hypothetical protein